MTQFRKRKSGSANQRGKVFPVRGSFTPQKFHAERSVASQLLDNSKKALLTEDPEEWARHPNRLDLVGIDTPKTNYPYSVYHQPNFILGRELFHDMASSSKNSMVNEKSFINILVKKIGVNESKKVMKQLSESGSIYEVRRGYWKKL